MISLTAEEIDCVISALRVQLINQKMDALLEGYGLSHPARYHVEKLEVTETTIDKFINLCE
jgi:hypothetical protein